MSARETQTLNAHIAILVLSSWGCILVATGSSITAPTFDEYVERFGKVYDGSEYSDRKDLYEKRLAEIRDHNAQENRTWNASVTSRTDAKPIVSKPRVRRHADGDLVSDMSYDAERSLPWSVDWRTRQPPVLTELFDQNPCGDCWAIHSVKALESHLAIATGELLQLSSQQAADCSSHGNSRHDCNYGGYPEDVYTHAAKHGIPLRQDYPRLGHGASCNLHVKPAAGAQGSVKPQSNNAYALMSAVAHHGPVSVGVDSSKWDNYAGGIFDGSRKDTSSLDHEVLLVGYGEENGRKYWVVQNSWGTNWGERGFIRLRRYDNEPCAKDTYDSQYKNCGESGILADTTYPKGVFRRHNRRLTANDSPPIEVSGGHAGRSCACLIAFLGLVSV